MTRLGLTPSQTVGPFLSIALRWEDGPNSEKCMCAGRQALSWFFHG